jgi:molecular chaperone GrpE
MSEEKKSENNSDLAEDIVMDSEDLDISFDDISNDNQDKINKLKGKIKQALKEKEEYLSGWQRCRADFVNAKRSNENDRTRLIESISESVVIDLLPVLDSFDLALADKSQSEKVPEGWRMGFLGIYSKLLETLTQKGLKNIGKVGDKFNINEQEPVAMVPVDKEEMDDVVTDVLQKGYSLNGRVIRPAKVTVGQYNR